ncbi:hypothetical protein IQ07DRAFT_274434 [Pyrenochaeta sp. DS3sAY3a]|nr:hypothetical protein IQ07DRAFT_274434 [Pyrenochaeta sp. DS3sAY3a]
MCRELRARHHHCTHTSHLGWKYCSMRQKVDRIPAKARECEFYEGVRYSHFLRRHASCADCKEVQRLRERLEELRRQWNINGINDREICKKRKAKRLSGLLKGFLGH